MSDTCIVCLGDLSNGNDQLSALDNTLAKSPPQHDATAFADSLHADISFQPHPPSTITQPPELIAHLQPCGHYLHNECLTPWVERANSCPICRASFHLVELMNHVGGTITSIYPVQDRTQVADLDPSIFLEIPEDEDDDQPCQNCGEDDNEDVLMYCDGCQKLWHTYCVGLQEVPYGHWYCDSCRSQRDSDGRPSRSARAARSSRRRTRGQQRRQRASYSIHDQSWNQVWQSVWSRINLDLDFPHEDDETSAAYMRRHRQRSNHNNRVAHDAWLRRMQVAELHGAGNRFRETEPVIVGSPGGQSSPSNRNKRLSPMPPAQSPDEILAWDAFDQARATSHEPAARPQSKKRKSRSSSSVEEENEPTPAPIIIKRRRTSQSAAPAASTGSRPSPVPRASSRTHSPIPRRPMPSEAAPPSFLQSLLQEVEDSSAHPVHQYRPHYRTAGSPPSEQYSPRPSSPALSPNSSNHPSPRAMSATPPPSGAYRPGSPIGLSSSIQPVFPSTDQVVRTASPEVKEIPNGEHTSPPRYSPQTSPASTTSARIEQPTPKARTSRILDTSASSPPHISNSNNATSPRANMSLTAKSDVQRLVSTALKRHYNEQKISKDEYTSINREISRMLYDRIGNFDSLDVDDRAKWEQVAGEEVDKAVVALRAQA